MATAEHAGAAPRDAEEGELQARHNELQAQIRRGWEDALTLPLSNDDLAEVERLVALSDCPVCLHLGDGGLYESIDRLRAQRALEQEEDPE